MVRCFSIIRAGLHRLVQRGWARLASGAGSRAVKYRHLLDDALDVTEPELAVLCVLMLRGPQNPGELKARTERMHRFESLGELHETLDRLVQRELVARLRHPGQKEERYRQLLGHDEAGAGETEAAVSPEQSADLEARISRLEEDVATLRQALESLAPMGSEYQPPGAGV